MVQRELERRQPGHNRYSGVYIFSGKIKCGECGSWYGSKVWHSNSKYRRMVWQCNHKFDNNEKCQTPHLEEENIKQLFVTAANKLLSEKDEIIDNFEAIKATLYDTASLETEQAELQNEMEVVAEMIQQCIHENAHVALDQMKYHKRYDGLTQRFEAAKARMETVTCAIKEKVTRRKTLETFLYDLQKQDGLITDFDPLLWHSLVDFVTVYSPDDVRFTFKNGTEISVL